MPQFVARDLNSSDRYFLRVAVRGTSYRCIIRAVWFRAIVDVGQTIKGNGLSIEQRKREQHDVHELGIPFRNAESSSTVMAHLFILMPSNCRSYEVCQCFSCVFRESANPDQIAVEVDQVLEAPFREHLRYRCSTPPCRPQPPRSTRPEQVRSQPTRFSDENHPEHAIWPLADE